MRGPSSISDAIRVAVYTAITFIATVLLVIETPATGGYFNLGEASIYAIAVLAPPLVTAIAAGLGPALADLVLGYWYFAPATFVIKFAEGFVVSALSSYIREGRMHLGLLRLATVVVGLILAVIVGLNSLGSREEKTGVSLSTTPVSLFGLSLPLPSIVVDLPSATWIAIGILIAVLALAVSLAAGRRPYVLPMAIGGFIMVIGYFLYEFFVSNPMILGRDPWGAFFELPVNVGQFTAGILLSYPVVHFVERARGSNSSQRS